MNQNERALFERLQVRYAEPEWALLSQVASGTGANARRWIDALAMNLYPSRGLALHGFEMKSSRSDWLRELKAPHKADDIHRYCDFWWVVAATKDIVKDGELPLGWGLLVPHGKSLQAEVVAQRSEAPAEIPRSFLGAVLRRAAASAPDREVAEQMRREVREQLHGEMSSSWESRLSTERERRTSIERRFRLLSAATGERIDEFMSDEQVREVGERIKAGMQIERTREAVVRDARLAADRLETQAGALRRLAEEVATE